MPSSGEMIGCGLVLRPREHVLSVHDREVLLTARESEIVIMLAEHPGWVFSAGQLSGDADGEGFSPESVSVHIARLRHKLEQAGAPDMIETVRGLGYRLRPSAPVADESQSSAPGGCRVLRDAAWQLEEAVFDLEHIGSSAQQGEAADVLDRARRDMYAILAE